MFKSVYAQAEQAAAQGDDWGLVLMVFVLPLVVGFGGFLYRQWKKKR